MTFRMALESLSSPLNDGGSDGASNGLPGGASTRSVKGMWTLFAAAFDDDAVGGGLLFDAGEGLVGEGLVAVNVEDVHLHLARLRPVLRRQVLHHRADLDGAAVAGLHLAGADDHGDPHVFLQALEDVARLRRKRVQPRLRQVQEPGVRLRRAGDDRVGDHQQQHGQARHDPGVQPGQKLPPPDAAPEPFDVDQNAAQHERDAGDERDQECGARCPDPVDDGVQRPGDEQAQRAGRDAGARQRPPQRSLWQSVRKWEAGDPISVHLQRLLSSTRTDRNSQKPVMLKK